MNKSRLIQNTFFQKWSSKRNFSSSNETPPQIYSKGLRFWHAFQAIGFTGCTISGFIASRIDPKKANKVEKEKKEFLMHLHKSFGLLMFGAMLPRVWSRLAPIPSHLPAPIYEFVASKLAHLFLNVVIVVMPLTGVTMGYFSGYGVPFFKWHLPGADKSKAKSESFKKRAGFFYNLHKQFGQILEYVLPIHIGAIGFVYFARGQNLLKRMNPLI